MCLYCMHVLIGLVNFPWVNQFRGDRSSGLIKNRHNQRQAKPRLARLKCGKTKDWQNQRPARLKCGKTKDRLNQRQAKPKTGKTKDRQNQKQAKPKRGKSKDRKNKRQAKLWDRFLVVQRRIFNFISLILGWGQLPSSLWDDALPV